MSSLFIKGRKIINVINVKNHFLDLEISKSILDVFMKVEEIINVIIVEKPFLGLHI